MPRHRAKYDDAEIASVLALLDDTFTTADAWEAFRVAYGPRVPSPSVLLRHATDRGLVIRLAPSGRMCRYAKSVAIASAAAGPLFAGRDA